MSLALFLSAFVSLFVVVDPLGTAAVFTVLTGKLERAQQIKIARRAVIIATIVLTGFCFAGQWILGHMGVSLAALRVAGGLLLFVTAFRMIMGFHDPDQLNSESSAYRDPADIAVFPLAIPLLAGPGTMTAALMFTTQATDIQGYTQILAALMIVQIAAFASMAGASWLGRVFGPTGNSIIARVMGVLLAAMAVQFIADGIRDLV